MKEISRQSLMKIHDVIHGQNYVNIKARLNQLLPNEYAKTFAGIKLFSTDGVWYGDDAIVYRSYVEASASDKEEIATWLEECKEVVCATLSTAIPYVHSLFSIPSQEQIFWYRNDEGNIRVTLAQWGFENKSNGPKIDVITMLLLAPRTLTQQDVTIHIDYSDGSIASNIPFILHLFNNTKNIETDGEGNFHLGKLFLNKTFVIENIDATNHYDFTIVKDGNYSAVFDWFTRYTIIVEDQKGERIPDFEMMVDGVAVKTNEEGRFEAELKLLPNTIVNVEANETRSSFIVQKESENNVFKITIKREEPQPSVVSPNPPVTPISPAPLVPEYIKVTLLDYDGQPLPNLPFVINKKKKRISAQTDENGVAQIDKAQFIQNNKYHIRFMITSSYRESLSKKNNDNER